MATELSLKFRQRSSNRTCSIRAADPLVLVLVTIEADGALSKTTPYRVMSGRVRVGSRCVMLVPTCPPTLIPSGRC